MLQNPFNTYFLIRSDHETAAEKCEEDEEGFDGCSEYLYSIQEKLGTINHGAVYAVYDYEEMSPNMTDELIFKIGDKLQVMRKGDDVEREWWWAKRDQTSADSSEETGYIPRNLLGLHPRVSPSNKKYQMLMETLMLRMRTCPLTMIKLIPKVKWSLEKTLKTLILMTQRCRLKYQSKYKYSFI